MAALCCGLPNLKKESRGRPAPGRCQVLAWNYCLADSMLLSGAEDRRARACVLDGVLNRVMHGVNYGGSCRGDFILENRGFRCRCDRCATRQQTTQPLQCAACNGRHAADNAHGAACSMLAAYALRRATRANQCRSPPQRTTVQPRAPAAPCSCREPCFLRSFPCGACGGALINAKRTVDGDARGRDVFECAPQRA